MQSQNRDQRNYSFPQKIWIAGSIFALIVVLILLVKATFNVFLLILAGVLIAVFFRGLSGFIEGKTKWNSNLCLVISMLGTILILVLLFWLLGAKVQLQVSQLSDTLPTTVEKAKAFHWKRNAVFFFQN